MKINKTLGSLLLTTGAVLGFALGTLGESQQVNAASGVATVHYVKGYGIALWNSPNANKKPIVGRKLMDGSSWKYFGTKVVNGVTWYELGANQWAEGRFFKPATHVTNVPVKYTEGILTINYVPGYGVLVRQSPNGKASYPAKHLMHGSSWKYTGTSNVNGQTWYRVGTNQWVQGKYISKDIFDDITPSQIRHWLTEELGVPADVLAGIPDSFFEQYSIKSSTGTMLGMHGIMFDMAKKYPKMAPYEKAAWDYTAID
ncbi:SLAP domain-containing protein [Lacticaseibacillus saniviri]